MSWWTSLRQLTSRSNQLALHTMSTLLDKLIFCGADCLLDDQETLVKLACQQWRGDLEIEVQLKEHFIGLDQPKILE